MIHSGTAVLEEGPGPGVDFDALRLDRRQRVLDAMDEAGIDVLFLARVANARYFVGPRPLWRAVVTGWGPTVIYVRSTGQISMLATTWDDGIPADVPRDNLSALTWNPRNIMTSLSAVEGLAEARTIAVDGMSPGMAKVFFLMAPSATLVDGDA